MTPSKSHVSSNNKNLEGFYWFLTLMCVFAIFVTVPLARTIETFIVKYVESYFFTWCVLIGIFVGFLIFVRSIYRNKQSWRSKKYLWIFGVGCLYIYFTLQLQEHPVEAIHLIQYSLLTFLGFMALTQRIQDLTIIFIVLNLVFFIGTTDEFIQWVTPKRYWDPRDVFINFASGSLFLFALIPLRFNQIMQPITKRSIKLMIIAISFNLALVGLIFSNTPSVINEYTSIITSLKWLRTEERMVGDYGYRNIIPNSGSFYSHFSLEELENFDSALDNEMLIAEVHYRAAYRNEHYKKYQEGVSNSTEYAFIAYKENIILESYYKTLIKQLQLSWSPEIKKSLLKVIPSPSTVYHSDFDKLLVTQFSIKKIWIMITLILIIILLGGHYWTKKLVE